jgi:hypothetical protein
MANKKQRSIAVVIDSKARVTYKDGDEVNAFLVDFESVTLDVVVAAGDDVEAAVKAKVVELLTEGK